MISKKNKELFTDFALIGIGTGIVSSIDIQGSGNPQVGVAKGVSTALPVVGTLIGAKLTLDLLDDFDKYTKKKRR